MQVEERERQEEEQERERRPEKTVEGEGKMSAWSVLSPPSRAAPLSSPSFKIEY